jgi:hypothetical protein
MTVEEMRREGQRRILQEHLSEIRTEGQRRLKDKLWDAREESNKQLMEIAEAVSLKTGCKMQHGPIKTWRSASRKLKTDYSKDVPEGDWLLMKDLVRTTLIGSSVEHTRDIQQAIVQYCGVGTSGLKKIRFGESAQTLHLVKNVETKKGDRDNECGYSGVNCVVILHTGHPGEIQVNVPGVLFGKGPKEDFVAAHGQQVWDQIKSRYQIESSIAHGLYEIFRENKKNAIGTEAADLSVDYYDYLRGQPNFQVAWKLRNQEEAPHDFSFR